MITGGGLAPAERFVPAGSTISIVGRRADKLTGAQRKVPALPASGVPGGSLAAATVARLVAGEQYVGYGTPEERRLASRAENDAWFAQRNNR
ncbi:hypothetical protein GCM10022406_13360 [Hymenobacter algoricola]|uniref:Uncharacterized protein n=1 Tax=Hymenobacter algoricola TaxID=486267 RepID=A0ABP7MUX6_9BACT